MYGGSIRAAVLNTARDAREITMPRFARLFEAAADTLNAYQAVADANLDALLGLWIDEDFASCVWADGEHLHGLDQIRSGPPTGSPRAP